MSQMQISLFLLFILFTAGQSLSCYCSGLAVSCENQNVTTCPSGYSNCLSSTTVVTQDGNMGLKVQIKKCSAACANGSVDSGITKTSVACCNTDRCNVQDAPEPSSGAPNGKKCYYCNGQICSTILSCTGSEDHCLTATGSYGGQTLVIKGCASKSVCDAETSVKDAESLSCCEGNLCNGAASISQSFLFLCCSLLSFILFAVTF